MCKHQNRGEELALLSPFHTIEQHCSVAHKYIKNTLFYILCVHTNTADDSHYATIQRYANYKFHLKHIQSCICFKSIPACSSTRSGNYKASSRSARMTEINYKDMVVKVATETYLRSSSTMRHQQFVEC